MIWYNWQVVISFDQTRRNPVRYKVNKEGIVHRQAYNVNWSFMYIIIIHSRKLSSCDIFDYIIHSCTNSWVRFWLQKLKVLLKMQHKTLSFRLCIKHCQRHSGPRLLSLKLELSLYPFFHHVVPYICRNQKCYLPWGGDLSYGLNTLGPLCLWQSLYFSNSDL